MSQIDEPVTVWTRETGEPERLVWRSRRFRVTDTPTALVGACDWWSPFTAQRYGIGNAPLTIAGWRFQATADDGETHVFDVHHDDRGDDDANAGLDADAAHWRLMRIFD